jgi:signal transduction histidine kinase
MSASLRLRLSLSHLAVLLTGVILAALLAWTSIEQLYLSSQAENLLAQARLIATGLQDAPLPLEAVESYSQTANILPGIHTRLLTEGGGVAIGLPLTDGGQALQLPQAEEGAIISPEELLARPEIQQALLGEADSAVRKVEAAGGGRVLYAAAPIYDSNGKVTGIVYLATPLPTGGLPFRNVIQLAGAVLAAGILAGGVGIILARRLARPLEELSKAASAVGGGNLGQQAPVKSGVTELDSLGRAFNSMTTDLQRSRRTREAFLADVTHELRTPLTVIQGTIETLEDGALDDREGRGPLLEGMQRESTRLIRLVNDLLVLTRADAGALQLEMKPVIMAELSRQRCGHLSGMAEKRRVELQVADETGNQSLGQVYGDADRLAQVLDNLLENAIRYSPEDTIVTVKIGREGKRVRTSVFDHGPGIPPEHLPFVFERFYRVESARDRRSGGSGLGLAIARSLVLAQGGEIRACSDIGKGTEMTFWLPAAELPSD